MIKQNYHLKDILLKECQYNKWKAASTFTPDVYLLVYWYTHPCVIPFLWLWTGVTDLLMNRIWQTLWNVTCNIRWKKKWLLFGEFSCSFLDYFCYGGKPVAMSWGRCLQETEWAYMQVFWDLPTAIWFTLEVRSLPVQSQRNTASGNTLIAISWKTLSQRHQTKLQPEFWSTDTGA